MKIIAFFFGQNKGWSCLNNSTRFDNLNPQVTPPCADLRPVKESVDVLRLELSGGG
jgi:hypothetical protein